LAAALAALAGISAKFGRFIYIPFGIVTLIQFVGNFFYSYSYIDPASQSFINWVDMISGFFEPMGIDPTDLVSHRRILALLTGGLIPFISLTFAHMLIVYSNKLQLEKENDVKPEINVDEISKKVGMIESEEVVEKINPTEDELREMEEKLNELQNKPLSQIIKNDQDQVRRLSYTKNV
jgi:hypothetical protein